MNLGFEINELSHVLRARENSSPLFEWSEHFCKKPQNKLSTIEDCQFLVWINRIQLDKKRKYWSLDRRWYAK